MVATSTAKVTVSSRAKCINTEPFATFELWKTQLTTLRYTQMEQQAETPDQEGTEHCSFGDRT